MSEKYITVKDYAGKHGITEKTVYNHIKSEKIQKTRIKKVLGITLIRE